jgi:NAD(P)-dependent dehydrogenase (short-subunit alcohol dehydrogenase family)
MEPSRIALVTGANKGIGLETARQLARAGLTVLLGARDVDLGRQAAAALRNEGLAAAPIELDLTKPDTVEAAAARIAADHGHLDVLVNNAAISAGLMEGPPSTADIGALRRVMETNFIGTLAVTQAMLPLLRQAPAARIVNVSSGLGSLAMQGDPDGPAAPYKLLAYAASKSALNMLTVQLAYELRETPIKVNAADPGYTATDLNGHRGTQTVEVGAVVPVRLALLAADGPTGGFFSAEGPAPW